MSSGRRKTGRQSVFHKRVRFDDGFDFIVYVQFAIDAFDVRSDGLRANAQLISDLPACFALG